MIFDTVLIVAISSYLILILFEISDNIGQNLTCFGFMLDSGNIYKCTEQILLIKGLNR
jgi:hypothetical protein